MKDTNLLEVLIDKSAIAQILGGMLKDNSLLMTDQYKLDPSDFYNKFATICYSAIKNLSTQGMENITPMEVDIYLKDFPNQYETFNAQNGTEFLQKCMDFCDVENFNYHYQTVRKYSLLRSYVESGMDITPILNPFSTNPKKLEEQVEKFNKSSMGEIMDFFDNRMIFVKEKFSHADENQGIHASDDIKKLYESLKLEPEVGLGLHGGLLNSVVRGARTKKFYLRSGSSGSGKAIPNDVSIPTPSGWRKVGDIKEGDLLFDRKGKPTKVLQVHPQAEKKEKLQVVLQDGRVAECCEEHLWTYYYNSHGKWKTRTETAGDILNRGLKNGTSFKFKLPVNEAVEYGEKDLSIDPYAFGLLLGDGSFRYDKTNKGLEFSSDSDELPLALANKLGLVFKKSKGSNYTYTFQFKEDSTSKGSKRKNVWVEEILKDYPKLWNVKSADKYIPREYIEASIEQRMELLRGLLDSDGSIDLKGRVSFSNSSLNLVKGLEEICRSLGFITTIGKDSRKGKYSTGVQYHLQIQSDKSTKDQLFHLESKKKRAIDYRDDGKRFNRKDRISIVDIERTGELVDMTCFTVDNEESLFLMNDFIVTHNTRMAVADACSLGVGVYYSIFEKKWISMNEPQGTLFITTELEVQEIQTMALAFVSGVDEDHILNGKCSIEEEQRINIAIKLIEKSRLDIVPLTNFDLIDVENKIRQYKYRRGTMYLFFDYIHVSLKLLAQMSGQVKGMAMREDSVLYMFSVMLKDLCNELNIFIFSSTQLNRSYETKEELNETSLRGAMSLADKLDAGMIAVKPTKQELELVSSIATDSFLQPNHVMHFFKVRRSKYAHLKLWSRIDLGTCQIKNLFVTDYDYQLIDIKQTEIRTLNAHEEFFAQMKMLEQVEAALVEEEEEAEKLIKRKE